MLHQNGWENDAMKHNVVLANEVNQSGVICLPPLFPILAKQLLGGGDVTQGRVKPDIQHLALSTFNRHRHAPV